MKYHRFQLLFAADRAGDYTVQALTPQGQGESTFVSPLPEAVASAVPLPLYPRGLGEQLFVALFQGDILILYEKSLNDAANTGTALRIELTFNPRNPDLRAIQDLPWELLRQPGTPKFLALSPSTPVTRFLTVPRPVTAAVRPQILRILAVVASPLDLPSLDLDQEFRNLQDAVGPAAQVIQVGPTLAALRKALCDSKEYHVFHFMGHGGGSMAAQAENVLFFETEDGRSDPVTGTDLANMLAASRSLRLAVLNSCKSASVRKNGGDGNDFNPFTGVANALVLADLPAVIAMQHSISDAAAITFSRTFYRELTAGKPVDAATTESRRAMQAEHRQSREWATPVLFLRTPTGELYPQEDLWDRPPEKKWLRWRLAAALLGLLLTAGAVLALRNWRVERLVTEGAAFLGKGQWAEARERFQDAYRLKPGSSEILSNLAGAEENLGDLRSAEDHYQEAVRRQPDSAEHLYNLGHFLNSRKSYDEAYRILLQSVEKDPQRADIQAELAQAAAALGMPGRARVHLRAALRLDPERPSLYRRLGDLELGAGNPQAALPHLNDALRRYPLGDLGRVETVWLLAQVYDRLGNVLAACREIREIRRLDPPGITPWAQKAEEMALLRACSP